MIRSLRVWAYPKATFSQSLSLPIATSSNCCYPERNFERNQLLGSSMSLSPLYEAETSDLHVNNAAGLHQPFDWLHPRLVKITTFRVYIMVL